MKSQYMGLWLLLSYRAKNFSKKKNYFVFSFIINHLPLHYNNSDDPRGKCDKGN